MTPMARSKSRHTAALHFLLKAGLIDAHIMTISDEELKRYRGCGPKTLQEVRRIINIIINNQTT